MSDRYSTRDSRAAARVGLAVVVALALTTLASVVNAVPVLYGITGAVKSASSLYTVDPVTGAAVLVGATGFSHIVAIDFDPTTGTLYGMKNEHYSYNDGALVTIDPGTAATTIIGTSGTGDHIPDITIGSDGILRAWGEMNDQPMTIDKTTSAGTHFPSTLATSQTGIATATANTIYVKSGGRFDELNVNDGSSVFLFNTGISLDNMLENAPDGSLLTASRVGGGTQFYSVDPSNGNVTTLGFTTGIAFAGLAYRSDGLVPVQQSSWSQIKSLYAR